jgi:hypothetical protein
VLFTQPDFINQKSHLEELITLQKHICDFYPKYHCIEQYWGAAKLAYRSTGEDNRHEEDGKKCEMVSFFSDLLMCLI